MFSFGAKPTGAQEAVAIIYPGPRDGTKLMLDATLPANVHTPPVVLKPGEHFAIEPTNDPKGRNCLMVGGMSGSGKSHICLNFAKRYHELWPDRPINLVSYLQKDATLDQIDYIKRIRPESFVEDPPKLEEFNKSLTIFDDIEGFEDDDEKLPKAERIAPAIQRVINMVASTGRHNSSSLIVSSHLLTNYKKTRLFLGEAHCFIAFPHGVSDTQYRRLFCVHGGCDRKAIEKTRKLPSRWVCLRKTYPSMIIHETGAYMLHTPGNDEEERAARYARVRPAHEKRGYVPKRPHWQEEESDAEPQAKRARGV